MALTEEAPDELKPALPDLPDLAVELAEMVQTAEAAYTEVLDAELVEDATPE